MAPSLEEELVSILIASGEEGDKEYLQSRIEELRNMGFKVNESVIEGELERRRLMQEYHSPDNRALARKTKKEVKSDVKNRIMGYMESRKREDPMITSWVVKHKDSFGDCGGCGFKYTKRALILITRLTRQRGGALYEGREKAGINYCARCGYVSDSFTRGILD